MVDGRPGGQRAGRSAVRRREFLRPSADHGAAIAGAGAARLRRTADRAAQGGRLYQPLCRRAEHAAVSVRLWAELYAFQLWRAAARLDEIGRASCRDRGCSYGEDWVGAVSL